MNRKLQKQGTDRHRNSKVVGRQLKILIANGVNLDLLGRRETLHYGHDNLATIEDKLKDFSRHLEKYWDGVTLELVFRQTNVEAEFLGNLNGPWDGMILNPGAWTHTSLALGDRLAALQIPFVEVHLSNLARREEIRHHSYAAPYACGVVFGFGTGSYLAGLTGLVTHLLKE